MAIPVTSLYGGLCALLTVGLGLNVSVLRLRTGTYVGKELPKPLVRPVRAHGNAAEWVPLGIVLLAVLELSGASSGLLHVAGGTFLAARALHAFGVLAKNRSGMAGATLTYLVVAAMGAEAIRLHFA